MLVWFAYFASVVDNFKAVLFGLLVVLGILGVIACISGLAAASEGSDTYDKALAAWFSRTVAWSAIVVSALYAVIPASRDIYFIAGTWVAKEVATSDVAKSAGSEVKQWLSKELANYREKEAANKKKEAK